MKSNRLSAKKLNSSSVRSFICDSLLICKLNSSLHRISSDKNCKHCMMADTVSVDSLEFAGDMVEKHDAFEISATCLLEVIPLVFK